MKKYFQELDRLLKLEQADDIQQYKDFFDKRSVTERRAEGVTWYPVAIRGTEIQRTDYLMVELERTTHHDIPSQFKSGVPAQLFSNHDAGEDRIDATVVFQSASRIRILIKEDSLPEWSKKGKLGLDLGFDNQSYAEMFKAIKQASEHTLSDYLTGLKPIPIPGHQPAEELKMLNSSQQKAVGLMASGSPLAVILGPPGTGKTTTIVQGVLKLLQNGVKKILLTAPSNMAVDLLTEKLDEEKVKVMRIGNPARISDHLDSLTLDYKILNHLDSKRLKKERIRANEFRNMAHKYKRNFGPAERAQRKALFDEAHKILDAIKNEEKHIVDKVLGEAEVITATLVGSSFQVLDNLDFEVTIIDEAGQALEPASLIPVLKSPKLILAGDPFQLPPTIHSLEAEKEGLNKTLIEKLLDTQPEIVQMLDTQYRMNERISSYSSGIFYQNKLKSDESVKNRNLNNGLSPFLFIDTSGCGYDEKQEGTSISNQEEAAFLVRLANELLEGLKDLSIGVISPYKEQLKFLKNYVADAEFAQNNKVDVNTIDSFQGQERDVILISLTRSNQDGIIGFLNDTRRMNVAMTRARKQLIIVGNSATISTFQFYSGLIEYAQKIDGYKSAWEYPSLL